ncbi:hypothetical protein Cgig2_020599 [Carnegiea gigantea]|uniref:Uncharacterized protein n=1 Tax=Carnegiea gigantea TaxID=171969 RepID=A0A9Q1JXW6_9CARY|nr:hypothetical protein Cgig2_020599 [Carnegiea gigantea]
MSARCGTGGFWRVTFDRPIGREVIQPFSFSSDTFSIEKIEAPLNAYKIVYSYHLPHTMRPGYLTLFLDGLSGKNMVTLTDDPTQALNVVFFKHKKDIDKEIHLSSDVQIDSGLSAYCRSDGFWRVSFDAYTYRDVIIASGIFSVPRSSFRIEKTEGSLSADKIAYSPPTTTSSQQQRYLTVFRDLLSGPKLVGLTDDSARVVLFVFFKIKKDVVASI